MRKPYHYVESGLDNVYLYNVNIISDIKGEQTISIPRINELHDVIASALLNKRGELTGKEVRFLRIHALFSQVELAQLIGKDGQTVGRWERGECPIDKSMDMLLRIAVAQKLGFSADITVFSQTVSLEPNNDNIKIDGANNQYSLIAA